MDWQTASDAKAVAEAGVRELREMLEQQQGKLQVDLKAAAEALAPAERQISQLRRDSDAPLLAASGFSTNSPPMLLC